MKMREKRKRALPDDEARLTMNFASGARDGLPIALGYFAVAITFGVTFVAGGFEWWQTLFASLTNFTGVGQFTGLDLIAKGTAFAELTLAMFIINIRYALMSVTVGQRLSPRVTMGQRFVIAFGMTDENFAVAVARKREITFSYWMGVSLVSFSGWLAGTAVGSLAGGILPVSIQNAFGIAIHAMFIAIIVPPCKKSLPTLFAVLSASALSCLFFYTPVLNQLSKGWVTVIVGVVCAVILALLFPLKSTETTEGANAESSPADSESREEGGR